MAITSERDRYQIQPQHRCVESDNVETNAGALNGSWYLENVDTSKGPLSEAAFLDHASDITLSGSDGEVQTLAISAMTRR